MESMPKELARLTSVLKEILPKYQDINRMYLDRDCIDEEFREGISLFTLDQADWDETIQIMAELFDYGYFSAGVSSDKTARITEMMGKYPGYRNEIENALLVYEREPSSDQGNNV